MRLLLERTWCKSLSQQGTMAVAGAGLAAMTAVGNGTGDDNEEGGGEADFSANDAAQCLRNLVSRGTNGTTRRWLALLVATRMIVAVPIADVSGFYGGLTRAAEAAAYRGGNNGGGYKWRLRIRQRRRR